MPNYRNPMQGGMPPQVPQVPQFGGPQMGPQGPPQPRQGPQQQGPGMGGQVNQGLQDRLANMPQFNTAPQFAMGGGAGGAQRGNLQGAIDSIQQQLMMAQINNANPRVIAALQMQLQQAQRAYQEAGMQAMFAQQQARPQPGARGVGQSRTGGATAGRSRANPYDAQMMQDWQNQMQLLMGLWGMGGGGGGGIGG